MRAIVERDMHVYIRAVRYAAVGVVSVVHLDEEGAWGRDFVELAPGWRYIHDDQGLAAFVDGGGKGGTGEVIEHRSHRIPMSAILDVTLLEA